MTVVAVEMPVRPKPSKRSTAWLIWRQQRATFAGVAVLACIACGLLIVTVLNVEHADSLGLRGCLTSGKGTNCPAATSLLVQAQEQLRNLKVALLVAPALIGAFCGAPLVAREHETGITRYSRTQGLRPEHWLSGTLLFGSAVVVDFMSVAGVLFNWATGLSNLGFGFTVSPTTFAAQFPALPAWSLLAYLLGAGFGMAIRRTVPAMGAALAGYGAVVYLVFEYLRPHYAALVFWKPASAGANPFWQYQILEATWLILTSTVMTLVLVTVPKAYYASAWKRAYRASSRK